MEVRQSLFFVFQLGGVAGDANLCRTVARRRRLCASARSLW